MRKQKVYLKVTNDIYELPIAIGDTPKELSEQTGHSPATILSSITHKHGTFRRLIIEVEDDE